MFVMSFKVTRVGLFVYNISLLPGCEVDTWTP